MLGDRIKDVSCLVTETKGWLVLSDRYIAMMLGDRDRGMSVAW